MKNLCENYNKRYCESGRFELLLQFTIDYVTGQFLTTAMDDPQYKRTPYTFDRVVRIFFSVIGVLGALYLLDLLKAVLLPFMVACLLAYLLEPIVKFNMKILHIRHRFIPVVLTLIEAISAITLFCVIFIPYLVEECRDMAATISKYATTQIQIPYVSEQIHDFIRRNVNFDEISR